MLGVRRGGLGLELDEAVGAGERGAGGGRTGWAEASAASSPRPARRLRLRAAISWRRATFSDLDEPSSERMAEIRESRSEMSASRVDMYSIMGGLELG